MHVHCIPRPSPQFSYFKIKGRPLLRPRAGLCQGLWLYSMWTSLWVFTQHNSTELTEFSIARKFSLPPPPAPSSSPAIPPSCFLIIQSTLLVFWSWPSEMGTRSEARGRREAKWEELNGLSYIWRARSIPPTASRVQSLHEKCGAQKDIETFPGSQRNFPKYLIGS